jgi:hypothetical protein
MPKLTKKIPKLSRDRNYAVVWHNSKKIVMGKFNSPQANEKYESFLADFHAQKAGLPLPSETQKKNNNQNQYSIAQLCNTALPAFELKWGEKNEELCAMKTAIKYLVREYPNYPVAEFSSVELERVRDIIAAEISQKTGRKKYSNNYINKLIYRAGMGGRLRP